jgi:hypothetical protein
VGCQEDGCQSPEYGAPYNSRITAQYLEANTTYYIVIDGFGGDSDGNYQLNVSESIGLMAPDSTNLPLILFDTQGEEIVDEPKVNISMKIIDNGPGNYNHPNDLANNYDGIVGIEYRGAYSSTLPQKPYGLETRDSLGNNNNVSVLGMPAENDWILIANYNDKTFLRNTLSFDLFSKMGHYAPRTQLAEVVLDSVYQGIYVFTEKIKRDDNRVDIATLDLDDNAGDSLSGGYIFKVDYWNSNDSWLSDYENPGYPGNDVRYVYDYPSPEVISNEQENYIQDRVSDFEDALWGDDFANPDIGYRRYIDTQSFIDYFLVNELARNIDGFKKSRRFHKDRDDNDSLIYAGPVWDFDWAYKDTDQDETDGAGWRHSFSGGTDVTPPGWYIRLLQDSLFANELYCRYTDLRTSAFHLDTLHAYVDDMGAYLDEAQERHYARWPILGVNVGTPEIGEQPDTYAGEIEKFKGWLSDRIAWLDENMPGNCLSVVGLNESERVPYWSVYPNPSNEYVNVYSKSQVSELKVYNALGALVLKVDNPPSLYRIDSEVWEGVFIIDLLFQNGAVARKSFVSY